MKEHAVFFISTNGMDDYILLNHGSGGRLSHDLIKNLFLKRFGSDELLTDSALLKEPYHKLAFTTDSYVVDPIFFPGGDIGKLAVCGTVNDLAVSGAKPEYIAASFIIEEGFLLSDLEKIIDSMADEAQKAGVMIVTGDTKVVEKRKCDKIFITTSGIGILDDKYFEISSGRRVKQGDKLIINGPVANHSIAVLGARNQLNFSTPVLSDCASLNHLIKKVLDKCSEIHFMRDLTRGGLATVLNELVEMVNEGIMVDEASIPIEEPVKGLCEILGFDPLYLANEGKVLFVTGERDYLKVLEILHSCPLGMNAKMIGEITGKNKGCVVMTTVIGGERILDMLSGFQLPRIC
jgi:hydrogenase expression/formation protein HypE